MSLITVNLPQITLDHLVSLLERITVSLERIAGPEMHYEPPYQAQPSDLIRMTPALAQQHAEAVGEFAQQQHIVPGSPAAWAAVIEYEELVKKHYGADAVEELPWRKVIADAHRQG